MLKIKAQAYSIEAANPRHEHEWEVWKEAEAAAWNYPRRGLALRLSSGTPRTGGAAHPALCQRCRARDVIASNDCGFATSAAGDVASTRDELRPQPARR